MFKEKSSYSGTTVTPLKYHKVVRLSIHYFFLQKGEKRMATKLPVIKGNTEQWIIDKMKHIADDNSRSLSKELEFACKQHIKRYELENGEIKLKN